MVGVGDRPREASTRKSFLLGSGTSLKIQGRLDENIDPVSRQWNWRGRQCRPHPLKGGSITLTLQSDTRP